MPTRSTVNKMGFKLTVTKAASSIAGASNIFVAKSAGTCYTATATGNRSSNFANGFGVLTKSVTRVNANSTRLCTSVPRTVLQEQMRHTSIGDINQSSKTTLMISNFQVIC